MKYLLAGLLALLCGPAAALGLTAPNPRIGLTLDAGNAVTTSGANGNIISASSITTTSGIFAKATQFGAPTTVSSFTSTGSLLLASAATLEFGGAAAGNADSIMTTLNASTTGQVINASAGQTADLVDISSPTATSATVRITSGGQFIPKVLTKALIDVETPNAAGAVIICSDCTIAYSLCTATGTAAAQWARAGSATVGCGTNN